MTTPPPNDDFRSLDHLSLAELEAIRLVLWGGSVRLEAVFCVWRI